MESPRANETAAIQNGQLVALGYGTFVRSDEVAAIEPIAHGRGPGRRTLIWLRGKNEPLTASRSAESIQRDLIRPRNEESRRQAQRWTLEHVARALDEVPGKTRRRLREADGIDLDALAEEAQRAIA